MEWVTAQVSLVDATGCVLSTASGSPLGSGPLLDPWIKAVVPGTVLQSLVASGKCPDPYVGLQSDTIGDAGKIGVETYTYWFCARFNVPKVEGGRQGKSGDIAWLDLAGVNYSLEAYANGSRLDLVGTSDRGTYLRRCIKLPAECAVVGKTCYLAILVRPPDHCGKVPAAGGQGGDHALGMDVAPQFLEGWDWTFAMPDRSTGIWGDVSLKITGPLRLEDGYSQCNLPDDAAFAAETVTLALITCGAAVKNAAAVPISAVVRLEISHEEDGVVIIDAVAEPLSVSVQPGKTDIIFPAQQLAQARLWWPINMGAQHLYRATFTVQAAGSPPNTGPSDTCFSHVGVRVIESSVDEATGGRVFRVNGHRVFVRGGNYICGDAYLAAPAQRYFDEVRMHALANINMLRLWGGAGIWNPAMLQACDEAGILLWLEFWITGDDDGRGSGDSQCPLDHKLWLECAEDGVRKARGHASLAIFVGGNEQEPCSDLLGPLTSMLARLVPDVDFVKGSLWDGFADGHGGEGYLNLHDGPYDAQDPMAFYAEDFYDYGFNPEVGSFSIPLLSSLRRFLCPESVVPEFVRTAEGLEMELWDQGFDHHKHMSHGSVDKGVANQLACYGVPNTLKDYCIQAQLASFVQYRALAEGYSAKMWRKHTGFIVWKTQSPVPALRGQIYDYYLQPTAALYALKRACEPLHAQVCPLSSKIVIVNTYNVEIVCRVLVSMVGLRGEDYGTMDYIAAVSPACASDVGKLIAPSCVMGTVYFLSITAVNASYGSSPNVYWVRHSPPPKLAPGGVQLPRPGAQDEFLPLADMRLSRVTLLASATGKRLAKVHSRHADGCISSWQAADEDEWEVSVNMESSTSPGIAPAVFVSARVVQGQEDVLPCFASDNFFTLVPGIGSSHQVRMCFRWPSSSPLQPPPVSVIVAGWNVTEQIVGVEWGAPGA